MNARGYPHAKPAPETDMPDHELSTNLLSLGLFDVAYSMDVAKQDQNTIYWLFKFCAVALMLHGHEIHDLVPDVDDESQESVEMFKRSEMVIDYIEERNRHDQISTPLLDSEIVARSISKLLRLQLHGDDKWRYQDALRAVEAAVASVFLCEDRGTQDHPSRLS